VAYVTFSATDTFTSIRATMNNMHSFITRFCQFVLCRAAVTLVALAWSSLAFCGEIHDAARAGNLEKIKALLKENPDLVFSKDNQSLTPLHKAAFHGHKDVADFLLASGAEVNATNAAGWTPLHLAAIKGKKDVAELLLANKPEVNAKDNYERTPLHLAATWGGKDVAELLLPVRPRSTQGTTKAGRLCTLRRLVTTRP
jgi:hypothetical protein